MAKTKTVDISRCIMKLVAESLAINEKTSIVVTLFDTDGTQFDKGGNKIALTSDFDGITINKVKDNKDGTYSAELTANKSGSGNVTLTVDEIAHATPAAITVIEKLACKEKSFIESNKASLETGETATLSVTLLDENGAPVSGKTVVINYSIDSQAPIAITAKEKAGKYSASFNANQAGKVLIGFSVNDEAFSHSIELTVIEAGPKLKKGKIAPGNTVYHDGKKFVAGSEISLPEADFDEQVNRGVILL